MNWKFCILFFLLIVETFPARAAESTNQQKTAKTQIIRRVGVEDFAALAAERNAVIVDVRTPREFESGHIKNAVNADFLDASFESRLTKLDKSKTCLVYCAGGARSARACKKMSQNGFSRLVDLAPGIAGWKTAKKPLVK